LDSYAVNVVGPLLVVQSYLPMLHKSSEPKVINASSNLGSHEYVWIAKIPFYYYGTSKAALNYVNHALSHALPNILFLSIHPGWVDTEIGNAGGAKGPTSANDSAQAIRYYAATKNAKQNQGEYLDTMTGNIIPY